MSKFQLILTGIFGVLILIGVLIFSLGKFGTSNQSVDLTVWGFLPASEFGSVVAKAGLANSDSVNITYEQKDEATFDTDFIEALASGVGPDLFMLSQDLILKYQDKIVTIPYSTLSERDFKDAFIEEGELYLTPQGILGIPFMIDPLVMYWNRTIFSNAGISTPPKYWSEFYDLAPRLTQKDGSLNVRQSATALGEYVNISHATEIMSTLMMQAGGKIAQRQPSGVVYSTITQRFDAPVIPATTALSFYTEFTNPVKPFYSWNRSLPSSKNYFISGDLATYFGYASEIREIMSKNPNLNFNVAKMPQSKDVGQVITFGAMKAFAVPKASKKQAAAIQTALILVGKAPLTELASITRLPPVRRDMLAVRPSDDYFSVFYESAVQARAWLQPDRTQTNALFKEMIESVTGNRRTVTDSVGRTDIELNLLFEDVQ